MLNIIVGILAVAYGVVLFRDKVYENSAVLVFLGIANMIVGVIQCK